MAFSTRHTPAGRADLVDRDGPANTAGQVSGTQLAVIVRVTVRISGTDEARSRHCAFIATDVAEVMRPLPIEPLPGIPSFVLGLSVIRGAPTPVVDTAALLGEQRPERLIDHAAGHTRFVVMRVGDRRVALAVEAVLGVRPLASDMLQALPPLLRHASETIVAALGTHDSQLLTVLAGGGYLLPPAVWDALAASRAPA